MCECVKNRGKLKINNITNCYKKKNNKPEINNYKYENQLCLLIRIQPLCLFY